MRFLKLPTNTIGRDFIVGDIHGCYNTLMELLEKAMFSHETDRLISVGDIIDRGPESEKCLQLIFEPWFFMTQGNHEKMFCDAVYGRTTFMHRTDYFNVSNGGTWTKPWFERNASELQFWADILSEQPYVLQVGEANNQVPPFWVVHAELRALDFKLDTDNLEDYVNAAQDQEIAVFQWARKIAKKIPVSYVPEFGGPIYCGHTPNPAAPHLSAGHLNLDGGAGKWTGPGSFTDVYLTMVCHQTGDIYIGDASGEVYLP